jgi:hypothetical protein
VQNGRPEGWLLRCSLSFEAGGRGMLSVETIGRIRREHFIKGKTIKGIAQDLKVVRNTVRKVLRFGCNIVREFFGDAFL